LEIRFRSKKLEQEFNEERLLRTSYGERQARKIRNRMAALRAAETLGDFWPPYHKPERCHELTGDRAGQLSMDLEHPYRLIFRPTHNPLPTKPDGGLDWFQVTAIEILGMEDTHD
jgi:proteic killer suppression protein